MPAPVPSPFVPESTEPVALADLAGRFDLAGDPRDVAVTGISLGTAAVRPGHLFIALQGVRSHGADHAADAVARGAVAVLTDPGHADLALGVPVLTTPEPRPLLGELAAAVYRTREHHPLLLGVTGTNGKTSTSHLLAGLLDLLEVPNGLSSTAERRVGPERRVAGLTTPEATELHALIARMVEAGVEAAAIEVSAQGLSRHRLDGIVFDVAGFTNLSHDHLDDYADMEEYYAAKAVLFQPDRSRRAVVSLDTAWGARVVADAGVPTTTIALAGGEAAEWTVTVTEETQAHTAFVLEGTGDRRIATRIPVLGAHMAANAGLAIVMLLEAGYAFDRLKTVLEGPRGMDATLPGRTELVSGPGAPAVYVDFGHSPHAFQETLAAVRAVTPGKVIMLFGADGDRDTTKRPDMARAAVAGSDVLVVTDHHPRFEDPASIRAVLVAAAREAAPDHPLHEEGQPEKAIRLAVSLAEPGDAILWAGPGHQNYRDIRGVRTDYSARREARAALREAGYEAAPSRDLQS
ncbi:Mur ligase family protein [Amnibacterium setariae]|uniref:UDP-N-acetylmuramyl-tripeptide synthetase n=1 Tax=Amnibacterium setariae TaxID=2306585 RepID=A0A3A1U1C4_9MICO|nr:UDP-N-acetylmuramoyl-L-alanyl-D-glutamate--2,6-diaminopimelate ligase [Amnibacterium setariae]RIX30321.1 UDP-N-acetylmuramoyl-L-alanyl-D-glutamate--2,6-diaminopimelate ligase [Amnibacterium setariae]